MNRIKDFIYDKNDLLVALIIVAAAALLIMSRVEIIMAYPTSLEAELYAAGDEIKPDIQQKPKPPSSDDLGDETDAAAGNQTGEGTEAAESDNPPADENVGSISIYIEYGATGSQIAQLLIDSGLIPNKEAFYDAVTAAGADTKLQAGNFKIPANATPAEIIRIITN
ncbi:hypothetical protein MASR2M70_16220 [Bacillota bacterium]